MPILNELATAVKTRRTEMGLTQEHLAHLAGLSRATISQVEQGSVQDLSLGRTEKLLSALGLLVVVTPPHPNVAELPKARRRSPLAIAVSTAHTSTREAITSKQLADALVSGRADPKVAPHLFIVLSELSVSLLASVVEQLHLERGIDRKSAWTSIRKLARQLRVHRECWV